MGRNKKPIQLVTGHHLTKEEIKRRTEGAIKPNTDKIEPPKWFKKAQKEAFNELATQLIQLGILTNLDVDTLTRYIIAHEMYVKVTKELEKYRVTDENLEVISKLTILQDKFLKQARLTGSDLGLSVSSRAKIIIPPEPKKNRFDEFKL